MEREGEDADRGGRLIVRPAHRSGTHYKKGWEIEAYGLHREIPSKKVKSVLLRTNIYDVSTTLFFMVNIWVLYSKSFTSILGVGTMEGFVFLFLQVAILGLALFWLHTDMKNKEMKGKIYWVWPIAMILWTIVLGLIGLTLALVFYYIWGRYVY